MRRKLACLLAALTLLAPRALPAQQRPGDPDVAKGVREVEEGELDAGIFTLDAAVRSLAGDPARSRDLAQAYLYLGIAFVGKAQETAARARFRDALQQQGGLSLSPDQFPPKVIALFEAARQELQAAAVKPPAAASPAAPAPSPLPQPVAAERKQGGSKKLPLILGALALGGGGVALAARGGSSEKVATETFRGTLTPASQIATFRVTANGAGPLNATLTWTGDGVLARVKIASTGPGASILAESAQVTPSEARLATSVTAQTYDMKVEYVTAPRSNLDFTLVVRHP